MSKRLCVVTGSRADYGHLYWLLKELESDKDIRLQIVVTGMHLNRNFGYTYRTVKNDGFKISAVIPILDSSNDASSVSRSIGQGVERLASTYRRLAPEAVVVLGDRFEIFSAAIAAYISNIPIIHIHGGETSCGVLDEGFRHCITKLSLYHFAAATPYRSRIIQLGENPNKVFCYGAPGLDWIRKISYLSRPALGKILKMDLAGKVGLITYHPTTLDCLGLEKQTELLLTAVRESGIKAIFSQANADPSGELINKKIRSFCMSRPERYRFVENMGSAIYFSCMKAFDLMVGNSSSGIIEAPSLRMPVVNVGDRQKNRVKANNIIDVGIETKDILKGIHYALSTKFQKRLKTVVSPYGDDRHLGSVSKKIKNKIKQLNFDKKLLRKDFFDILAPDSGTSLA